MRLYFRRIPCSLANKGVPKIRSIIVPFRVKKLLQINQICKYLVKKMKDARILLLLLVIVGHF